MGTTFRMRERIFGFGDDYWIEDDHGERAFFVDGKVLRLHDTLQLKNTDGDVLATVHKKVLSVRDAMKVERDGDTIATVKKAWFAPIHDKFIAELPEGDEIEITGDLIDKEFDMRQSGEKIAEVSRKWFHLRDTYGIKIADGTDVPLILAVAICVERLLEHHGDDHD